MNTDGHRYCGERGLQPASTRLRQQTLKRRSRRAPIFALALLAAVCGAAAQDAPKSPEAGARAPGLFDVRLETSKGTILIEVHRDWAPHGADRFYNLVRAGYYDGNRFFRVIRGRWAQFGVNGDPKISNAWRARTIPDDGRRESNVRGTVAFAFAAPDGRTTEVFINLRDNSATHDPEAFVPFGKVIAGMDVADALNPEYGEASGGGIRGGKQEPLFKMGNAYLDSHFPRLDYIRRAVVVEPTSASK